MTWLEIAAIAVLLIGIGAGGYLVAQRPTFWWGLGVIAFKAAWPFLSKRMTRNRRRHFKTVFVGAVSGIFSASDVDDQTDPLLVRVWPHSLDVLDGRRNQFRAGHRLPFRTSETRP